MSGMNRTSDSGADVNPYIRPAISSPISLSELLQNRRRSFRLRLCQWAFEQKSLVTSSNSIENIEVPDVPAVCAAHALVLRMYRNLSIKLPCRLTYRIAPLRPFYVCAL